MTARESPRLANDSRYQPVLSLVPASDPTQYAHRMIFAPIPAKHQVIQAHQTATPNAADRAVLAPSPRPLAVRSTGTALAERRPWFPGT